MTALTQTFLDIVAGAIPYARKCLLLLQAPDESFVAAQASAAGVLSTSVTGEVRTISRVHHEIHEGEFFDCPLVSPELDTATYYWSFTTADSAMLAHFELD